MVARFTRADLRPYQRRMCKLAYEHPFCGLLLKVGGGKTIVSLTLAEYLLRQGEVKRVLVVGPLRVVNSVWQQEAEQWEHTRWLKFSRILGSAQQRQDAMMREAHIYLINVDNFAWLTSQCGGAWKWDMIICDEFSLFKNQSALRSKALRALRKAKVLKRLIGLTGTPASNGMADFWHQVWLLDLGQRLGRYKSTFMDRYFYLPPSQQRNLYAKPVLRPNAQDEIHDKVSDICYSLAPNEYPQLPAISYHDVKVDLPDSAMRYYRDIEKQFFATLDSGETIDVATAAVQSNKLLQCANGAFYVNGGSKWEAVHRAKLDAVKDIVEEAAGDPVLIAYVYNSDRDRLLAELPGAKTLDKSAATIDAWNRGEIPVLVAHPASAGHGINLQFGGSTLVWFGLTWSLELYEQMIGRLYRPGQSKPVFVHRIMANGTIDFEVKERLTGKMSVQEALMAALHRSKQQ